jgi:transcriptional regulator with XRE-family HTH domain
MSIGSALRQARREARLSQAALARRLGTTQSAVARAETDAAEPSLAYLRRVAAATGRSINVRIDPPQPISEAEAQRRWALIGKGREFDPWRREPEAAEVRQLERSGVERG